MQKRPFYKLGQDVAAGKQPDWKVYADQAQSYLDRPAFGGTPLTGKMFANSASNTFARTGTHVPVDLALSQGQWESGMGRKGRSPANNPFNVGEFDDKTVRTYKSPQQGMQAYYDLIANKYLTGGQKVKDLYKNFAWAADPELRYASRKTYEKDVGNQAKYIREFIRKMMAKRSK